jgi:acyl-CoA dehydrogenase
VFSSCFGVSYLYSEDLLIDYFLLTYPARRLGRVVDFSLTEEQQELRRLAHQFAEKDIKPVAAEYDKTEEYPWELARKVFDLGLLNAEVPTEYGGGGLSTLESCIMAEEMGWGCAGIATALFANDLAAMPIIIAGNEEQKKKYLGALCSEFQMAAFCLTEPEAGSDVSGIQTTAVRDGDDYIINGRKCFISNGGVANLFSVFASTDKEKKHKGLSAFILTGDMAGISRGKREDKMGQRASDTSEVIFEDVRVPKANLLMNEGDGFKISMMTLDRTRPSVGALGVGVARRALEEATQYSLSRVQFGLPIAMNQAIQFMLADMAKDIEAARLLCWQAAWMADQGIRQSKESAIAKTFATDVAMRVTTDALQVFGGYGYMKDYPMEKLMRDAKLLQIYEGTNQIQRGVIAKAILMP